MPTTNPDPGRRPTGPTAPVVPLLVTIALVGFWLLMWAFGTFHAVGPLITGIILLGDLIVVALIWLLWVNGKLGRKP